jgi:Na+-driven multidrug efflux pump
LPAGVALAATDALGVGGFINWLMLLILGAIGVGSTALSARAVGRRH